MGNPTSRRYARGAKATFLTFMLVVALLPMTALSQLVAPRSALASQAAGNLVALGYSITDASGGAVTEIHKGDTVNVTLHMRNTALATDQVKPADIDVTKLSDSFSAGELKVTVTSVGSDPLTYDVELSGISYSGVGKVIEIMGGVKGDPASYETEDVQIREAVVYAPPEPVTPTPSVVVVPTAETSSSDSSSSEASGGFTGSEGSSGISASASNPDPSVPNVIIDRYSYGGGGVAAGSNFTLGFDFRNTGKLNIENIVVSIDGGESFTMNDSTNTFFYDSLSSGAVKSQDVPLQAVATAKSGAQSVGVTFKYEYVDGSKRTAATSEIKLSVPVSLPDRFQITAPVVPTDVTAGSETALTLPYVNKGKGEVSNLEATIEGDGIETTAKTQYIGNIAAGGSGSIGFALTPKEKGSVKVVLKVSYEDPNLQVRTAEFPVTLEVAEAPVVEEAASTDAEQQAGVSPSIWVIAAVLLGGGVACVLLVRRRRRKALQAASQGQSWDGWDDGPYGDGPYDDGTYAGETGTDEYADETDAHADEPDVHADEPDGCVDEADSDLSRTAPIAHRIEPHAAESDTRPPIEKG